MVKIAAERYSIKAQKYYVHVLHKKFKILKNQQNSDFYLKIELKIPVSAKLIILYKNFIIVHILIQND